MILNVHSDASYHSAKNAKSRAADHFFLGWQQDDKQPIRLNGPILTICTILKFVAALAAEAELGAIFLNAKEAKINRLTLEELVHLQTPTPMHCNNATAAGIANNTVKIQRSRSMEMRFLISVISSNMELWMSNGTRDKKIMRIMRQNIMTQNIIKRYDRYTYDEIQRS